MTANVAPVFELTPQNAGVTILPADTTVAKTIFTAGAEGSRIDSILVSSTDSAAMNLAFYIDDGVTSYYIGNVSVPIGSGYTTVARVDAMQTLKPAFQNFIALHHGYTLKANVVVAVTAGRVITIVTLAGDF